MEFTEEMARKQFSNRQDRSRKNQRDPEEEETLLYRRRKRSQNLNDSASSLLETKMNQGINTAPNIFDATAIFHTKENDR